MRGKVLNIETIQQLNSRLGTKTLHPLVSVIDLSKANLGDDSIKFDFYTILLIDGECNNYTYGRKHYDYSNATLLFCSPGQITQIEKHQVQNGWLLAFHPDLICGITLGVSIGRYTFFSYHTDEALHLSLREKFKAVECLMLIEQELEHGIDRHSQLIISKYIELFLDYNSRFYERQFITRSEVNKEILNKMELLLDEYTQSGKLKKKILPSVKYCSEGLNLSSDYFIDLLNFETGRTLEGYFQLKQIETAKKMLLSQSEVHQIVEILGYPNVQYFSELFQKITGVAPSEYRMAQN